MAKKVIGIELGIYNTKVLVGQNNKEGFKVLDYSIFKNTETTYNYNGELNIAEIEPILSQYVKDHKLKNKECYVTVSSTKAIVRNRSFPKVKLKDLKEMVKFEAEQFLPYEVSAFYIDFRVLGEIVNGNEELLNVMVVAVPKIVIDDFVELTGNLKLNLKKVDIVVNSIYDFYLQYISNGEKDVLITDIGSKFLRMIAFRGNEYFANTVSENGIESVISHYFDNFGINKDEMREYIFNGGKLNLSKFKQIEKDPVFKDFGTLSFGSDVNLMSSGGDKGTEEDYSTIMTEIRNSIIKEVLKMKILFKRRGNQEINKVVLYGGTVDLSEFVDKISEKAEIECFVIPEKNVHSQDYYLENLCEEGKNAIIVELDRDNMRMIAYKGSEYFVNLKSDNGINKAIKDNYKGIKDIDEVYKNLFNKSEVEEDIDIDYSLIIKEINKMLSFFRSRKYDSNIDEIFICGGGANAKFIRESIESETEIPTHIINYDFEKSIDEKDYSVLVPMIGSMVGR